MLIAAFAFSTEPGTAFEGPHYSVIQMSDPIIPEPVLPETKPPTGIPETLKNLAPVVTEDTSEILTPLLTAEELVNTTRDRDIRDTTGYLIPADPVVPPVTEPFVAVEEMPEFPGGTSELLKFLSANVSYPEEAISNNIQGRVILKFVVNADGSIDRIQILKGIDTLLDNEAVRVVKTLPKFIPGKQQGVPVPVWFSLPVLFRLENN
jgi:protein TonB